VVNELRRVADHEVLAYLPYPEAPPDELGDLGSPILGRYERHHRLDRDTHLTDLIPQAPEPDARSRCAIWHPLTHHQRLQRL